MMANRAEVYDILICLMIRAEERGLNSIEQDGNPYNGPSAILVKVKPVGAGWVEWAGWGHWAEWAVWAGWAEWATRWQPTQIWPNWPPDGTQLKFAHTGHQMSPNSNLPKLATRCHITQICPNWPPDGTQLKFAQTGHQMAPNSNLPKLATR